MFLSLVVLYLEYDKKKYPDSFKVLQSYLKNIKFFKKQIFVIDNANENQEVFKLEKNIYKIGGDNSCWEFSGWQKGLNYLNENNIKYDLILFVNDSFLSYEGSFLSNVSPLIALRAWFKNKFIGKVDTYEEEVGIQNYLMNDYIRSNCYFLSKKILDRIPGICLVNNEDLKLYVDDEYSGRYFKYDAPLNETLKDEIVKWLSSTWHSKFEIKDNWPLFRNKVRAMLNELLLNAKVQEAGFRIRNSK